MGSRYIMAHQGEMLGVSSSRIVGSQYAVSSFPKLFVRLIIRLIRFLQYNSTNYGKGHDFEIPLVLMGDFNSSGSPLPMLPLNLRDKEPTKVPHLKGSSFERFVIRKVSDSKGSLYGTSLIRKARYTEGSLYGRFVTRQARYTKRVFKKWKIFYLRDFRV